MNADEIRKAILDAYALGKRHAQADAARSHEIDKLLTTATSFADAPKRGRKPKEAPATEAGPTVEPQKAEEPTPKAARTRKPKDKEVNGAAVLGVEDARPSSDFPM